MVEIFKNIATSAVALLIAALAIYLALKLLGKLAKFVIGVVVLAVVAWLLFQNREWIMSFIGQFAALESAVTGLNIPFFGA